MTCPRGIQVPYQTALPKSLKKYFPRPPQTALRWQYCLGNFCFYYILFPEKSQNPFPASLRPVYGLSGVQAGGGSLSDAQLAEANAAIKALTGRWGENSRWSGNAVQQWEGAKNNYFGSLFPQANNPFGGTGDIDTSDLIMLPMVDDAAESSAKNDAEQQPDPQLKDPSKNASSNGTPDFSVEKTYIDDNPETHTEEQMQRIEEYKQAVDPGMIGFISLARENPTSRRNNYSLGTVTSKQAQRIREITGIDVTGFSHNMSSNTIRHIDRRHGISGVADHSMANTEDIARVRYVMENADSIDLVYDKNGKQVFSWEIRNSDNTPAVMIQYTKALDGVCYVIQAVADSKAKKLRIVSAYIGPKQSVPPDEASA